MGREGGRAYNWKGFSVTRLMCRCGGRGGWGVWDICEYPLPGYESFAELPSISMNVKGDSSFSNIRNNKMLKRYIL